MKYLTLLLLLILSGGQLSAQYSARNNDNKLEADYYLMTGDYQRALRLYLNVLKSEPQNADMKYKAGICYLNSENEKLTAIQYLEEAVQSVSKKYNANSFKEMNAPTEAHFLLGSAYRVANRLDDAINSYNTYKSLLEPRDEYNHAVVDQYLKSCMNAKEMLLNPANFDLTNLGETVNTSVSNFNPVISGNGSVLAYTATGARGFEIYFSKMTDSTWAKPVNITTMLGSAGRYLRTTGITYDGSQLFFAYNDPFDAEIYTSRYARNRWSRAEKLDKPINGKSNEIHCSISADGKTLYFVSDRSGGEGDFDIYKATLNNKGEWAKPVNLGPSVNTLFKEDSPFISADGRYLYFSSEGHSGMGGLDIFRTDLSDPGAEPYNLGYPVNNTDNNTFFVPWGEDISGYYATIYNDTYGSNDIYLVSLRTEDMSSNTVNGGNTAFTDFIDLPDSSLFVYTPVPEYNTLAEPDVLVYDESVTVLLNETQPFRFDQPDINKITVPENAMLPKEFKPVYIPAETDIPEFKAELEPAIINLRELPLAIVTEIPLDEETEPVTRHIANISNADDDSSDTTSVTNDISASQSGSLTAASYTVQIAAGKKPLDMRAFNSLDIIMVTFGEDEWYRYSSGMTTDVSQAETLKNEMVLKGFHDAFIVDKTLIPAYTIQVMAVPGPIVSASNFTGLPFVMAVKGKDMYVRYSTGEFVSLAEAEAALDEIRDLGFRDAFVRKVW